MAAQSTEKSKDVKRFQKLGSRGPSPGRRVRAAAAHADRGVRGVGARTRLHHQKAAGADASAERLPTPNAEGHRRYGHRVRAAGGRRKLGLPGLAASKKGLRRFGSFPEGIASA